MKSRDDNQLAGTYVPWKELLDCNPAIKVSDMWPHQRTSVNNQPLNENNPAIPCGLVAKSLFNDTFEIWKDNQDENITINDKNISWATDR